MPGVGPLTVPLPAQWLALPWCPFWPAHPPPWRVFQLFPWSSCPGCSVCYVSKSTLLRALLQCIVLCLCMLVSAGRLGSGAAYSGCCCLGVCCLLHVCVLRACVRARRQGGWHRSALFLYWVSWLRLGYPLGGNPARKTQPCVLCARRERHVEMPSGFACAGRAVCRPCVVAAAATDCIAYSRQPLPRRFAHLGPIIDLTALGNAVLLSCEAGRRCFLLPQVTGCGNPAAPGPPRLPPSSCLQACGFRCVQPGVRALGHWSECGVIGRVLRGCLWLTVAHQHVSIFPHPPPQNWSPNALCMPCINR